MTGKTKIHRNLIALLEPYSSPISVVHRYPPGGTQIGMTVRAVFRILDIVTLV